MAGHDKMMMRGAMSDKEMDMMSDTDNQRQLQKMMKRDLLFSYIMLEAINLGLFRG